MATLPGEQFLLQQIDGDVVLFDRYTEDEIVRFDPSNPNSFGPALKTIWLTDLLDPEQKCFAAFWTGYFHAHSTEGF
jgi:hypothetical protein